MFTFPDLFMKAQAAKVLSIDQRNDVLTNLVAIAGAVTSNLYHPFLDPLAASLISFVLRCPSRLQT